MEGFVRGFIRSSLVWLGVGVLLGLGMALLPAWLVYRPAHMHANLLGFVSMMIFGVAYHVIPRFAGSPLRSRGAATAHLWVANAGLFLLVGGMIARVHVGLVGVVALQVGGVLSAVGAFLFIHNLWRTLGGPPLRTARIAPTAAPGSRTRSPTP